MGSFEFPCPSCGQTQKVRAPNGSEVQARLCPACQEKANAEAARTFELEEAEEAGKPKARR